MSQGIPLKLATSFSAFWSEFWLYVHNIMMLIHEVLALELLIDINFQSVVVAVTNAT